jgi:hypothetical protein
LHLDYFALIRDRLTPVLRRLGEDQVGMVEVMASNVLDTIILASLNFPCTALHAFLRFAQNAFVISPGNAGLAPCGFCGAAQAFRLSHLLMCGAIWVFLAEQCPGLGWDFSAPNRWHFLFGSNASDSVSACMLVLAWDAIHAGVQAGRFAGNAFDGAVARLIALSKRPGMVGQLARAMSL